MSSCSVDVIFVVISIDITNVYVKTSITLGMLSEFYVLFILCDVYKLIYY